MRACGLEPNGSFAFRDDDVWVGLKRERFCLGASRLGSLDELTARDEDV
jgi:hypothetical protein